MVPETLIHAMESEVLDLEQKAEELEQLSAGEVDFSREAARLREEAQGLLRKALAKLDGWQALQLARHPSRPTPLELSAFLLEERVDVGGGGESRGTEVILGQLLGRPVVVLAYEAVAHLEGLAAMRATLDSLRCAERAVALAGRTGRPLVMLINAVERGSPAGMDAEVVVELARLGAALAELKAPSVALVTAEVTGPLAHVLLIADEVLMMRYAVLGGFDLELVRAELCDEGTPLAAVAQMLVLRADDARERGFVDALVEEPEGGAQRDPQGAGKMLRSAMDEALQRVCGLGGGDHLVRRATQAKGPRGYKER